MTRGKRRILFLCTGNACRSPMAEGWLRHLAGDRYESLSAGSHAAGFVHPLSVRAMAEAGVDISGHRSKSIGTFLPPRGTPPDVLVSLCDFALGHCPRFPPGTGKLRWPVYDPILAQGNEDLRMSVFRGVRDEIRLRIEEALGTGELDHPTEFFERPRRRGGFLRGLGGLLRGRSGPRGRGS